MKRFLPVIGLILLASSAARAEPPVSQPDTRHMNPKQLRALIPVDALSIPGRTYVKNRMLAVPGYEAMRKYYPAAANAAGQSGVAILECQFDQMGNLHNCDTLAEMPQDYGFGAATIELAQKYFTMDMRDLDAQPNDDWIKIIVNWPH
jgi:hypothetical protein